MSSFNKILKKVRVGTVAKDGKEIVLSVATSTSNWNRTEDMAKQQGSAFKAAVENSLNVVGRDTKEISSRESKHTSSDPRDHYTGVQLREVAPDDNVPTDGKSSHFEAKK
ncbi:hypothetical protein LTR33_001461 [Friedmanniomyces endolithicus]|nr:hypothetical protein LTR33_001461 [Friedmanniomyces endolithicus]